jgi:hypothetical protein
LGESGPDWGRLDGVFKPRPTQVPFITATTTSQNPRRGSPSTLRAVSRATISDSVELWLTQVCFFAIAFIGKKVLGPTRATKAPEVDLEVWTQSAKDASEKQRTVRSLQSSPTKPSRECSRVVCKYEISLWSRLSQALDHFVTCLASMQMG